MEFESAVAEAERQSASESMPEDDHCVLGEGHFKDTFVRNIVSGLISLQELERLPISTVDKILDEMKTVMSLTCEYSKDSILALLKEKCVNVEIQVLIVNQLQNNIFMSSVEAIDSSYKRRQYVMNHFPYVKPVTTDLGMNSHHKRKSYQYVPVFITIHAKVK